MTPQQPDRNSLAPSTTAGDGPIGTPLARFARAHLRTRAQRAVYQTVGSNPESWWRAAEIAAHKDLDHAEIDQALRSFAAAGILHERTHPSGGRIYRWHDELRYLFQRTSPPADLIDPVCGMPVDTDSPHTGHDATGVVVHFCSTWCRAAHRARLRH